MEIALETLLDRSSTRTYSGTPPTPEQLAALTAAFGSSSIACPFGYLPRFSLVDGTSLSRSGSAAKIGTYGVVKNAPVFIVGAVASGPGALLDYGYALEGILLIAAAVGLGSCWLAGTFSRSAAAAALKLGEGEIIPAVSPVGQAAERRSVIDAAMCFGAGSGRRKAWAELFFDGDPGRPLDEAAAGAWRPVLEAVRRGPSASNKQPWRILRTAEGSFRLLFAEDRVYNRALGIPIQELDLGIALRRFETAARICGLPGSWSKDRAVRPGDAAGPWASIASWR